ncbi:MAG: 50S ribosomal protein L32 [Chlamydiales bacterium]|nr:50S ribosomal protein L32 [Chlamydiales bacterium]
MAVPRSRSSNQRKNTKRAHHAKKAKNFISCPNCGAACLSHRICPSCGYYNNRPIFKQEAE